MFAPGKRRPFRVWCIFDRIISSGVNKILTDPFLPSLINKPPVFEPSMNMIDMLERKPVAFLVLLPVFVYAWQSRALYVLFSWRFKNHFSDLLDHFCLENLLLMESRAIFRQNIDDLYLLCIFLLHGRHSRHSFAINMLFCSYCSSLFTWLFPNNARSDENKNLP